MTVDWIIWANCWAVQCKESWTVSGDAYIQLSCFSQHFRRFRGVYVQFLSQKLACRIAGPEVTGFQWWVSEPYLLTAICTVDFSDTILPYITGGLWTGQVWCVQYRATPGIEVENFVSPWVFWDPSALRRYKIGPWHSLVSCRKGWSFLYQNSPGKA